MVYRHTTSLINRETQTPLSPQKVLELSDTAVGFLQQQFLLYDSRDENMLSWEQLQGLFSTAPCLPTEWQVRGRRGGGEGRGGRGGGWPFIENEVNYKLGVPTSGGGRRGGEGRVGRAERGGGMRGGGAAGR